MAHPVRAQRRGWIGERLPRGWPPFPASRVGPDPASLSHPGRLAQLVEHLLYTQGVGGSIPSPPIAWLRRIRASAVRSRGHVNAECQLAPRWTGRRASSLRVLPIGTPSPVLAAHASVRGRPWPIRPIASSAVGLHPAPLTMPMSTVVHDGATDDARSLLLPEDPQPTTIATPTTATKPKRNRIPVQHLAIRSLGMKALLRSVRRPTTRPSGSTTASAREPRLVLRGGFDDVLEWQLGCREWFGGIRVAELCEQRRRVVERRAPVLPRGIGQACGHAQDGAGFGVTRLADEFVAADEPALASVDQVAEPAVVVDVPEAVEIALGTERILRGLPLGQVDGPEIANSWARYRRSWYLPRGTWKTI